jgi:hypothetical protein
MAMITEKCGNTYITSPSECTYVCACDKTSCEWAVWCPDNGGWRITSGTSKPLASPGSGSAGDGRRPPRVTLRGDLEACANAPGEVWNRRVTVPEDLRGLKIRQKRTVTGTPAEIATALGLTLARKRRPPRQRSLRRGDSSFVIEKRKN